MKLDAVVDKRALLLKSPQRNVNGDDLRLRVVGLHLCRLALPIPKDGYDLEGCDLATVSKGGEECITVKLLNPFDFLSHDRVD
jgi:hypothetical protein